MSDEIEARLRAGESAYPEPSDEATRLARAAFMATAASRRGQAASSETRERWFRRRPVLVAAVFAAAVAAAFGGGFSAGAESSSSSSPSSAAIADAPGFLPAPGWNVLQSGSMVPPEGPSAIAANVPIAARDLEIGGRPHETIDALGARGILLYANFIPAGQVPGVDREFPDRSLPLRLRDAAEGSLEGMTNSGRTLRMMAQVGGYDADILVIFGAAHPDRSLVDEADAELGRLVIPGCPTSAVGVGPADLEDAVSFVAGWLRSHYLGAVSDLEGAESRSYVIGNGASPHDDVAIRTCGAKIKGKLVEVVVTLPERARPVAGRLPLAYFVYKTPQGWRIWRQA
jgi:hypothetical protein